MSTGDKFKATAKTLEGKAEEALGNLTGDTKMKVKGNTKQV